jgi:hypothetical protein
MDVEGPGDPDLAPQGRSRRALQMGAPMVSASLWPSKDGGLLPPDQVQTAPLLITARVTEQ